MRGAIADRVQAGGFRVRLAAIAVVAVVCACGSGIAATVPQGELPSFSASMGSGPVSTVGLPNPVPTPAPVATASASPAPTPAPAPSPTPAPAPTPSATPLPSVGAAPAGAWTGIRWISAGKVLPAEMTDRGAPAVFGWSRGYVAFAAIPYDAPDHMVTSSSADGLHWTPPRRLALPSNLQGDDGVDGTAWISRVIEGPSGLLAVGSDSGGACSGPTTYDALWTSRDGISWRPVTLPRSWLESTVWAVAGGSTGYIAGGIASDGETQALWLSRDGRSWHSARLPRSAGGKVVVDDVTDFAGGYVLVGTVVDSGGCGGPSTITATVWWSPSGRWWAQIPLGGPRPRRDVVITLTRITDHVLVATVRYGSAPDQYWFSTTGRRWTRMPSSRVPALDVLTDGRRAVSVVYPGRGWRAAIATVGSDLTNRVVRQHGPGPVVSDGSDLPQSALGPTGVLVVGYDDASVWLAVPTSR